MRQKFLVISRAMIVLSLILSISAGILMIQGVQLMSVFGKTLFVIAAILFCVNLASPGIFVLFKVPWLAHAWLIGMNPIIYSDIPWEKLSSDKKSRINTDSIVALFVVIAFTYWVVMTYVQK